VAEDDVELWARQRAGQRSGQRALVRVAARPSALARVLRAADACSATVVGRAALGESFVELDAGAIRALVAQLPGDAQPVLLDAPESVRQALAVWGQPPDRGRRELMRRVKARFDPAQVCNPGVFVGGI
jgi:FAD/FMN-containing dehydrogenase